MHRQVQEYKVLLFNLLKKTSVLLRTLLDESSLRLILLILHGLIVVLVSVYSTSTFYSSIHQILQNLSRYCDKGGLNINQKQYSHIQK